MCCAVTSSMPTCCALTSASRSARRCRFRDGQCPGVAAGGTLHQVYRTPGELRSRCDSLEDRWIDVSGLNMGQAIHASDVKLPTGVSIALAANTTVCVVTAPKAEKGADAAAGAAAGARRRMPPGDKAACRRLRLRQQPRPVVTRRRPNQRQAVRSSDLARRGPWQSGPRVRTVQGHNIGFGPIASSKNGAVAKATFAASGTAKSRSLKHSAKNPDPKPMQYMNLSGAGSACSGFLSASAVADCGDPR